MPSDDPPRNYKRNRLSNYEGFKRLDKSLEKLELQERGREKVCDVCGRRMRAWRIVPATFGHLLTGLRSQTSGTFAGTPMAGYIDSHLKPTIGGPFRGKFVVACDAGKDSCAAMLDRAGVPLAAMKEQAQIDACESLGVIPVVS